MNKEDYGVHATHCCNIHGCKYDDQDCPVVAELINGIVCEECMGEAHNNVTDRSVALILYDVLSAVEWVEQAGKTVRFCPECKRYEAFGHYPGCKLDAALKKARGEK